MEEGQQGFAAEGPIVPCFSSLESRPFDYFKCVSEEILKIFNRKQSKSVLLYIIRSNGTRSDFSPLIVVENDA